MSTVLFFVLVGLLSIYGLCEGLLRIAAWVWLPRDGKPITLVRCDAPTALSSYQKELWEQTEGRPVIFWSADETVEENENSLSNLAETLLFLSK